MKLFLSTSSTLSNETFLFRSSYRRCSVKKGLLRYIAKFTGKHLCQSLFFNIVAGLRPVTLLKKRLWHRCFPVNFAKFLRTLFFTVHLRWPLLNIQAFICNFEYVTTKYHVFFYRIAIIRLLLDEIYSLWDLPSFCLMI